MLHDFTKASTKALCPKPHCGHAYAISGPPSMPGSFHGRGTSWNHSREMVTRAFPEGPGLSASPAPPYCPRKPWVPYDAVQLSKGRQPQSRECFSLRAALKSSQHMTKNQRKTTHQIQGSLSFSGYPLATVHFSTSLFYLHYIWENI